MKKLYLGFLLLICFMAVAHTRAAVSSVLAQTNNSTDLAVTCSGNNATGIDCEVSPADTPMFDVTNILPGDTFTQKLTADNQSSQNGTFAFRSENLRFVPFANPVLSDQLTLTVHENTPAGPVVYGPVSLTQFVTDSQTQFVFLTPVNSEQFRDYYVTVGFNPAAGNEYQNKQVLFDLQFVFDFVPFSGVTPTPTASPGGSGSPGNPGSPGGSGSVLGTTSSLAATCSDTAPTSAPSLSFTESSTADGQVTLSWSSVSPVSTYAINFGTTPGVYQYGNNNVGNVSTYTVTGLVPGFQYYFQVLGVNGCEPGPRSNEVVTVGTPVGGAVVAAPGGFAPDQVLGVATQSEPLPSAGIEPFQAGEVLGAEVCRDWKKYLPWILLIAQAVLIAIGYLLQRAPVFFLKQAGMMIWTAGSILIYYWLRECDCYSGGALSWLCQWYWWAALLESTALWAVNHFFIQRKPR